MRIICVLAIVPLILIAVSISAGDELPITAEVRRAAERSLPYLEREGIAWIKERGCMSCHTFSFTVWSHQEAQRCDVAVDETKLAEWVGWAREAYLSKETWFKLTYPTGCGIVRAKTGRWN